MTESTSGRTVRVPRPVWAVTATLTATVLLLAAACATPPPPGAAAAATSGAPGPSSSPPTGAPTIPPGDVCAGRPDHSASPEGAGDGCGAYGEQLTDLERPVQ